MQRIIAMAKGTARMPQWSMAEPVDFELCDGEHIAVIGPNGAGKSMFIDLLTGRHPTVGDCTKYDFSPSTKPLVSDNIKYITFKDSYGDSDGTYYLQQRWNQHDISEDTPTVGELLENAYQLTGDNSAESNVFKKNYTQYSAWTAFLTSTLSCCQAVNCASSSSRGRFLHARGCWLWIIRSSASMPKRAYSLTNC